MGSRARHFAVYALLLTAWCSLYAAPAEPERIVAIGDIHGSYDGLVRVLGRARLIDGMRRWTGGRTVLVQTGDFTDRGPRVRAVMDLLMSLQKSAPDSGGQVHVLFGNHEAMNLLGLTRDVSREAMSEFADGDSERHRNDVYDKYVSLSVAQSARFERPVALYQPPPRAQWLAARPLGFLEYLAAFGPAAPYGQWLRSLPVAIRVGDTIFMHAGVDPSHAPKALDDIDKRARKEIDRFDDLRRALVAAGWALPSFTMDETLAAAQIAHGAEADDARWNGDAVPAQSWSLIDPEGPLWFRGLAMGSSEDLEAPLSKLLKRYSASRFVVGHSVMMNGRIGQRFDGRVVLIDTGMLTSFFPGGRGSALEIVNRELRAIYDDGTVVVGSKPEVMSTR